MRSTPRASQPASIYRPEDETGESRSGRRKLRRQTSAETTIRSGNADRSSEGAMSSSPAKIGPWSKASRAIALASGSPRQLETTAETISQRAMTTPRVRPTIAQDWKRLANPEWSRGGPSLGSNNPRERLRPGRSGSRAVARRPVLNPVDRPLARLPLVEKRSISSPLTIKPLTKRLAGMCSLRTARDDNVLPSLDPVTDVVGREFDGFEG